MSPESSQHDFCSVITTALQKTKLTLLYKKDDNRVEHIYCSNVAGSHSPYLARFSKKVLKLPPPISQRWAFRLKEFVLTE